MFLYALPIIETRHFVDRVCSPTAYIITKGRPNYAPNILSIDQSKVEISWVVMSPSIDCLPILQPSNLPNQWPIL